MLIAYLLFFFSAALMVAGIGMIFIRQQSRSWR
jgi:hypothetical protein